MASPSARFTARAQELLDRQHPGEFNQAMMELGATICVPKSPRCRECPVVGFCKARAAGRESELPVKARKQTKVDVDVVALVIRNRGRILLRRRADDVGQMSGFWELPELDGMPQAVVGREVGEVRHTITHHHYLYRVHEAKLPDRVRSPLAWVEWKKLDGVLLTTAARKALALLEE